MSALQLHPASVETDTQARKSLEQTETYSGDGKNESQPAAEANADQPFIDNGLAVPETYDLDIIRAMVQDPFRVFVYWDIRQQSIDALTRHLSANDAAAFRMTLKLIETKERGESFVDVERRGSYWVAVIPGHEYEFEIAVRSADGYISLIRSNRVRAPNRAVSPIVADEAEYRLSLKEFIQVLEASGFASEFMPKPEAEREIVRTEAARPVILSGRSNWKAQVIADSHKIKTDEIS